MRTKPQKQPFESYLQQQRKIIYKVCYAYCRNPQDREDLSQEIILQLWKAFPNYNPAQKASTWTYRIALNVAISFYRKEGKRQQNTLPLAAEIMPAGADTSEQERLSERLDLLNQFIQQLDGLNKALMLLYLDDHSYQEIADALGITPTNVATKISRTKQKLKTQFEQSHTK